MGHQANDFTKMELKTHPGGVAGYVGVKKGKKRK
jgi:hypothetical protein